MPTCEEDNTCPNGVYSQYKSATIPKSQPDSLGYKPPDRNPTIEKFINSLFYGYHQECAEPYKHPHKLFGIACDVCQLKSQCPCKGHAVDAIVSHLLSPLCEANRAAYTAGGGYAPAKICGVMEALDGRDINIEAALIHAEMLTEVEALQYNVSIPVTRHCFVRCMACSVSIPVVPFQGDGYIGVWEHIILPTCARNRTQMGFLGEDDATRAIQELERNGVQRQMLIDGLYLDDRFLLM